ncbi:osteoclast-stimulating factor 1-like [Neocloeon triangulifer]|uniref:osteoclast-stimulating factor 1-like n=1 Tax=Neocloeon triangulifer TaxID=2078957 RepID=UPI00286F5821|nr:osteoclast-stimulating factor 1-like [Neocloeon triangulifer]XP_059490278.1 osteoclast-stimulating factor 1-like [Neocloeon triangulifer]XP_059490279.1 osteoclast-stimulating factor 1-like [Neocloeon triangulifer]
MSTSLSRTPSAPKIAPKPGKIKVVRALYDYSAQNPDELTFQEGDVLYVLDQVTDQNWWRAKCGPNFGLIPSNYVETCTEEVLFPLHDAARRGNLSNLKQGLSEGVSATSLDHAGNTALLWACHSGQLECVQELLKIPSEALNAQNRLGDTPLHSAASKGHLDVVNLLLEIGADTSLKNTDGLTALDLASTNAIKSVIQRQNLNRQSSKNSINYSPDEYEDDEISD